jgi:Rod binding domain-containing protein
MDPIASSRGAAEAPMPSRVLHPEGEAGRIRETAQEFEGVFIGMLLKAMRTSVGSGGLFKNGMDTQTYRDMFDQEVGRQIAKGGGIGLAQLILRDQALRQLTENEGKKTAKDGGDGTISVDASREGAAPAGQQAAISPPENKSLKFSPRTPDRTTDEMSPTGNGGTSEDPE